MLLSLAPTSALAAASSQSFGLQGAAQLAAGSAGSASFGLQSCVDAAPVGRSSSASYALQSGCPSLAAAAGLPPVVPPFPPDGGDGEATEPVPSGQPLAWLLLTLAMALLAANLLRQRSRQPA